MNRTAIALAALGAFANAASAQSSVTVFGALDVGVQTVSNDQRTYSLGTDGMTSSRLGFRGIEDLGGGLKASFWLEMAVQPDTGRNLPQWGNGGTGGNQLFFNRRSTVSLANQWGEVRLGRDYTPTFYNWTVFDPFSAVGMGGSVNLALGLGLRNELTAAGGTYGTLVRANNMVSYILPNGAFGPGLYGQVSAAAGEGANGNKFMGGRVGYAAGPFDVAASYGKTSELLAGSDIDADVWNVAGSWKIGIVKLSGFFGQIAIKNLPAVVSSNGKAGRDNWFVGVTAPVGQWNLKATYGGTIGKDALNNDDASQWAIGADYNLSTRTAIYGTWSSINNDNRSRFVVSTQASNLSAGQNSTGAMIGIRHLF